MRLVFLLLILASSGCTITRFETHLRSLPDGHFDSVRLVEDGKFSSTTIEATKLDKTGNLITAEKMHAHHSNAWVPNLELTIEGWRVDVTPPKP